MCEILVMIKTKNEKISKDELRPFLMRCIQAGAKNKDGYGVMCETWFLRSINQFDKAQMEHVLKEYAGDSRFFAVHVRFATCEIKKEFTHPFVNGRFMLMHNGVVDVDKHKSGSDSLDLFNAIDDAFKSDYAQAIKTVTANMSGSYSVLSFVMSDDALYYFRNSPDFDFMFLRDKGIIYGATDIDRLKPLQTKLLNFFETALESRPLRNVVYKIDLKSGRFSRVVTVTEKEIKYSWESDKTTQSNLNCGKTDESERYRKYYGWDNYGLRD